MFIFGWHKHAIISCDPYSAMHYFLGKSQEERSSIRAVGIKKILEKIIFIAVECDFSNVM